MKSQPAAQIPGVYHRRIGDIVVTTISDGYLDGTLDVNIHLPPQHQLTFIYSRLRGWFGDRNDLPDCALAGRHLRLSRRPDGLDPGL